MDAKNCCRGSSNNSWSSFQNALDEFLLEMMRNSRGEQVAIKSKDRLFGLQDWENPNRKFSRTVKRKYCLFYGQISRLKKETFDNEIVCVELVHDHQWNTGIPIRVGKVLGLHQSHQKVSVPVSNQ